jgi:hypothetical protein
MYNSLNIIDYSPDFPDGELRDESIENTEPK